MLGSFQGRKKTTKRLLATRSISPRMRLPFVKIKPRPKRSVHEKPSRIIWVGLGWVTGGLGEKVVKDAMRQSGVSTFFYLSVA